MLPGRELASAVRLHGHEFSRRRFYTSLMRPMKRRILTKLLAIKFIVGDRKLEKLFNWETKLVEEGQAMSSEHDELLLGDVGGPSIAFSAPFVLKVEEHARRWKNLIKSWEQT